MQYNTQLQYTAALEPQEFNDTALILDTETIGSGPLTEIIEVALGVYLSIEDPELMQALETLSERIRNQFGNWRVVAEPHKDKRP